MSYQKLAWVPSASDRRSDISADMPAAPFRMRESVVRETCRRWAALVTSTSPRYSRNTLPGCGGLNICVMVSVPVIVLIVDENCVFSVEFEGESPIAADPNGPMAIQVAFQWM